MVIELVGSYGLWIVLAAVFLTMHWFGMSCCGGGHQHGTPPDRDRSPEGEHDRSAAGKDVKR